MPLRERRSVEQPLGEHDDGEVLCGRHDRPRTGALEHLERRPEADREGEQISGSDGPLRRDSLVERAVGADEDAAPSQLGKKASTGSCKSIRPPRTTVGPTAPYIGLVIEAMRNS